jgi:hypothetical protein
MFRSDRGRARCETAFQSEFSLMPVTRDVFRPAGCKNVSGIA